MATKSKIEWTNCTWNPVVGCSVVSPGCHSCYAMVMARRLKGVALKKIAKGKNPGRHRHYINVIGDDGRWNGKLAIVPEALDDPLRWRKPKMVFVNSMSDLFHEQLAVTDIRKVFEVMAAVDRHTYQVLTKRPRRMRELLSGALRWYSKYANLWLGTSVENKRHGLPRIEELRQTPAAARFLSLEPLLEDLGAVDLSGISWVILGGESGSRCRPMQPEWVRSIQRQCQNAGVPFFFKQWGGRNKKAAGRQLDGQTWDEMPLVQVNIGRI